jgi:hypothetical protein
MVAMAQRLDARSLFFRPLLSVSTFLAFVREICRNRFSCHSQSLAELAPSKLSNFGHSGTIHGPHEDVAGWEDLSASTEPGVGAKGPGGRQQGLPGLGTPTAFL